MKRSRITSYLLILIALVLFLSACGQVAPHPPRADDEETFSAAESTSTDIVALYFDNTRNTRGYIFGVENSSFVRTMDQIHETMLNGWTGRFYALCSELNYVPLQEAIDSRRWTRAPKPTIFANAFKLEEFYEFSVFARGRGPLRRLVEDTEVDRSIINVFVTDLIEQDNQSSVFARWLTQPLLEQQSNISVIVLRIESGCAKHP